MRVRVKLGEKPPLPKGRSAAEFDVDGRRFSFCKEREREMDYLVSNVGNSCSCPRPLWRRFRYSFTCFCLEAIAATRSQRWLLWSYMLSSWRRHGKLLQFQHGSPIPHTHTDTHTHTRYTQSLRFVCQLFCVRTLLSQRLSRLPPTPGPALLH